MSDPREELVETLATLARAPYDFVIWAFPWGEAGTELEGRSGPEDWQRTFLLDLQNELQSGAPVGPALTEAYQAAVRSGHDIGKTATLSWIFWWSFATREDTRGRATANTERQLRQILQPEIAKWHRLFIARDLFRVDATSIRSADPERRDTWRFDLIPWSEDNPEAFAGLHNYGKRVVVIFDEASGIHDKIWEVTDGVMHEADTELFWFCFGNPTKNYGRFYECWHRFADIWRRYKVDSRSVSFTNKAKIEQAIAAWGVESDYVKVRYLGEFPDASSVQLIPVETIRLARTRSPMETHYEPLILSADIARFGSNETVVGFRRGKDARTIPTQRWRGLSTMETADRIAALALLHEPDGIFVDEGGVGGGVVDRLRQLGHSIFGVNFGSKTSGLTRDLVGNKRAEMYVLLRDWLREGGCIEDADDLEDQLVAIEYFFNKKSEIMLVAKEDMEAEGFPSPDWADQLALSFAYPVSPKVRRRKAVTAKVEYDPYSMAAFSNADVERETSVTWEKGEPEWTRH